MVERLLNVVTGVKPGTRGGFRDHPDRLLLNNIIAKRFCQAELSAETEKKRKTFTVTISPGSRCPGRGEDRS
jgi:hypothetical protein